MQSSHKSVLERCSSAAARNRPATSSIFTTGKNLPPRSITANAKLGQFLPNATEDDFVPNSYLDRDAALKRLNAELEQRSQEIFKKIEQYSNRCKLPYNYNGAGDAPPSPHEMLSMKLQSQEAESYEKSNFEDHASASRTSTADEKEEESLNNDSFDYDFGSRSNSSMGSKHANRPDSATASIFSGGGGHIPSQSSKSCPTITSPETQEVDLKARKRLQKATESVVKCLQSKLISHEGRLADLHLQFRQKIQENTMLEGKIRALEDDRERLLKSMSNLQSAAEKSSKAAEVAKSNLNAKMQAFASLKKEIDALRRDQKSKVTTVQNLQTRLNRCVEENDRLKNQNRSLHINMKDRQYEDRGVIDELQQRVCQLEQQKSILNATISKQTGLIKTLRTHKVQMSGLLNSHNIQYTLNNNSENI